MSEFPDEHCPKCGGEPVGIEILGAYDGILFWHCPKDDHNYHRWPATHPLRRRAERWVSSYQEEQGVA